ncbi:MAG: hypothetical protein OXI83_01535, partial [Gemmatimonadota bacterium]|nr:hypothetical protein [Gemmatimonadota bacterium]
MEAADPPALSDGATEDVRVERAQNSGVVNDLEIVAEIGAVGAEALHGVVVGEAHEGRLRLDPGDLGQPGHETFAPPVDVLGL